MTSTPSPRRCLTDMCREVIADLARHTTAPEVSQILAATRRQVGPRLSFPAQVATQVVAGVAANYFRHYAPGDGWRSTGHDLCLGAGTTDLTWSDSHGHVIADTVLTGVDPRASEVAAAARQLRARAHAIHDHDLVLMRVLVPRSPQLSCLVRPDHVQSATPDPLTPTTTPTLPQRD